MNCLFLSRCVPPLLFGAAMFAGACSSSVTTVDLSDKEVRVIHPGREINSPEDDYAPVLSPDGTTLFFTSRQAAARGGSDYDKLYRSELTDGSWSSSVRALPDVPADINEGSMTMDLEGNVFFVQCYLPDGVGDCDLYRGRLIDRSLKNIRNAGEELNSMDWDSQPSITGDGSTLYFASERRGGRGGSDIYVAQRGKDGSWSRPENLGPVINTSGDEKTPYISQDGNTLYFASEGHAGYGGFDLFRSTKTKSGWAAPLNMGKPFNSRSDDLFFALSPSGDTAMLASNRTGSIGGLDTYFVVQKPKPIPPPVIEVKPLIVRVKTLNAFTLLPVESFLTFQEEAGEEERPRTDREGLWEKELSTGMKYFLTAERAGFLSAVDTFYYPAGTQGLQIRELLLVPVREEERVIYSFRVEFDFSLFNIRPEERRHLDSVVVLLAKFPHSTVVISGHTDSVGTEGYNLRLGWNRAKEVSTYVDRYLKEKGARLLNPLEIRTYGEDLPIASNSTDEGRQRNRRVEIAIVRYE